MFEPYVFVAIALVVTGVVLGVLVVVVLGIRRDDRRGGFPADTNGRVTRGVRRVTTGAPARDADRTRQDTWWPNDDSSRPGGRLNAGG